MFKMLIFDHFSQGLTDDKLFTSFDEYRNKIDQTTSKISLLIFLYFGGFSKQSIFYFSRQIAP